MRDLLLQTKLPVATEKHVRDFRCPCRHCNGGRNKSLQVIWQHHVAVGREDLLHGYPRGGMWVEDVAYDDDIIENVATRDNAHDNFDVEYDIVENVDEDQGPPKLDEFHEVHRQSGSTKPRRCIA